MKNALSKARRDRGFSLIEMLIVVGIIAVMAAVGLPAIGQYIRNYRIRSAESEVAGEIQAARAKAIATNTNAGVSFVIVDGNSYRWVIEDLMAAPLDPLLAPKILPSVRASDRGPTLGPLRDLPLGVRFVAAAGTTEPSFQFNRLGATCVTCVYTLATATACTENEMTPPAGRCVDDGPGVSYVRADTGNQVVEVQVTETATGLQRWIHVAPGGRILSQP
jgi:prepilin-type N-terminal cleavage/methylation domain-containing protein